MKFPVIIVDGEYTISVKAFASNFKYDRSVVTRMCQRNLLVSFKAKHKWYIFVPKQPIKLTKLNQSIVNKKNLIHVPSRLQTIYLDWERIIFELPPLVSEKYKNFEFKYIYEGRRVYLQV